MTYLFLRTTTGRRHTPTGSSRTSIGQDLWAGVEHVSREGVLASLRRATTALHVRLVEPRTVLVFITINVKFGEWSDISSVPAHLFSLQRSRSLRTHSSPFLHEIVRMELTLTTSRMGRNAVHRVNADVIRLSKSHPHATNGKPECHAACFFVQNFTSSNKIHYV